MIMDGKDYSAKPLCVFLNVAIDRLASGTSQRWGAKGWRVALYGKGIESPHCRATM